MELNRVRSPFTNKIPSRKYIIIFMLILATVLIFAFIVILNVQRKIDVITLENLKSNVKLSREIIESKYPGEWYIKDGHMYKGALLINDNSQLVDEIALYTEGLVTLFQGNKRISTNVLIDGKKALFTSISPKVEEVVIKKGIDFIGEVDVRGQKYLAAYIPIKNNQGDILGVWALAAPEHSLDQHLFSFIKLFILILVVAIIMILVLLFQLSKFKKEIINLEKNKLVSQLAASIAHEVRNPLTVVKGFIQLLIKDNETSQGKKEILNLTHSELIRAETVISDYLSLAKPHPSQKEVIDVKKELQHVINIVKPYGNLHSVDFKLNLNHEGLILGERNKFHQALLNILKNGVEAIPTSGIISVDSLQKNKKIIIQIADNGVGMTKEQINNIGKPFYSTKTKGTGLGMMVSISIIEAMQGKVKITSEVNKGTCFSVTFPLYIRT